MVWCKVVYTVSMICAEKRPRWWLVEAATSTLLRVVLLHLQLAQAWVDMAVAVVRLWRPAGRGGMRVAVDGGDHCYTFDMVRVRFVRGSCYRPLHSRCLPALDRLRRRLGSVRHSGVCSALRSNR